MSAQPAEERDLVNVGIVSRLRFRFRFQQDQLVWRVDLGEPRWNLNGGAAITATVASPFTPTPVNR